MSEIDEFKKMVLPEINNVLEEFHRGDNNYAFMLALERLRFSIQAFQMDEDLKENENERYF